MTITPKQRGLALIKTRNLKMARSAHAYVRGSTAKFYEWLEGSSGRVPEGPPIWICGDCHLGNLGPLADAKGRVEIQIRDLDQTVIGNPAHDVIRLALSLASAARSSDLPGFITARIVEALVGGYEAGLASAGGAKRDKTYRPRLIQKLLRRSVRRRWHHLANERLSTVKPIIPLGTKFWALSAKERAALRRLFRQDDVQKMITSLQGLRSLTLQLGNDGSF